MSSPPPPHPAATGPVPSISTSLPIITSPPTLHAHATASSTPQTSRPIGAEGVYPSIPSVWSPPSYTQSLPPNSSYRHALPPISPMSAPPLTALSSASSSSSGVSNNGLVSLRRSELMAFTGALRDMLHENERRAVRQDRINETNNSLHAMNFFLNFCNAERSQKLEREYSDIRSHLETGRALLTHLNNVITSQADQLEVLDQTVNHLANHAEEQDVRVNHMEESLLQQKHALTEAMSEYEHRLSLQESEFRKQEAVLARLLSVRFKLDFGLDLLLVVLGWYASHNAFSDLILRFIGQSILFRNAEGRRKRNRQTNTFMTLVQFALFLLFTQRFRTWAVRSGLHHSIGGWIKYGQFIGKSTAEALGVLRTGTRAAITLDPEVVAEEEQKRIMMETQRMQETNQQANGHAHYQHAQHEGGEGLTHQIAQPHPNAALGASSSSSSSAHALHASVTQPLPPDFSELSASSLGRSVGAALLGTMTVARNSLKFLLDRVVGTGMSDDMDLDQLQPNHTSINSSSSSSAVPVSSAAVASSSFPPATHVSSSSTDAHQPGSIHSISPHADALLHPTHVVPSAPSTPSSATASSALISTKHPDTPSHPVPSSVADHSDDIVGGEVISSSSKVESHETVTHQCPFPSCDKRFTQLSNLRRHVKVHSGHKDFSPTMLAGLESE